MKPVQKIVLILLVILSPCYSHNPFSNSELQTIKKRMSLYHIHTNLIFEQEKAIEESAALAEHYRVTLKLYEDETVRQKRKNVLVLVGTFISAFGLGYIIGNN